LDDSKLRFNTIFAALGYTGVKDYPGKKEDRKA